MSSYSTTLVIIGACTILPSLAFYIWPRKECHPPGPAGLPIIGNTHQVPRPFSWKWYEELQNVYGKIFRVNTFNDNCIVLSDPKVAEELLGRRSANYSSRKYLPYMGKYRSQNRRMLLMPYNEQFKKQRAAMALLFRPDGIVSNRERQNQQAKKLLYDLMTTPQQYQSHLMQYAAGVALGVAFGLSIEEAHAEAPHLVENTDSFGEDLIPGFWLVDAFPWLDIFPDWLASWRSGAIAKHQHEVALFKHFARNALSQESSSIRARPLVTQIWDAQEGFGLDDESILYRAQDEIDHVVGGDRTPDLGDFKDLPYLFAIVKEVLRWIPIQKGSQIVLTDHQASIWNMHRDSSIFVDPSPDIFEPLRWYDPTPTGQVREDASFFDGIWTFGSCPGKRLAVDSLWITISNLLWAFDIAGKDQEVTMRLTPEEVDANLFWRDSINIVILIMTFLIMT
ncbi:hypothetical protein H0H92_015304 [Tricholoma furcatifolium]|nr:hypothetical protein H0H92_015304 [Tricholoma furcatifolium]